MSLRWNLGEFAGMEQRPRRAGLRAGSWAPKPSDRPLTLPRHVVSRPPIAHPLDHSATVATMFPDQGGSEIHSQQPAFFPGFSTAALVLRLESAEKSQDIGGFLAVHR